MKKFMSLLLALSLLLSVSLTATAATSGQLSDGDNEIELPWDTDEASVYTYTATQTGTMYISTTAFYDADGDYDYRDNYAKLDEEWAMYTELTVDGQLLEGLYYGAVEVVEGQTYTISWAHGADVVGQKWYKLGWKAVINISYNDGNVPKEGSLELPVELYPVDCPTDSIEIPAGGSVWYALYEFHDAEFIVTGENAYVNATMINPETFAHESVHLEAQNGVVTMPVSGWRVLVEIGNAGSEPAVFQLDYQYPLGGDKNPDTLVMGENVANAKAGSFEGYTYEWTAQCDGVLTLTMPEKNWTVVVYNLTVGDDGQWFDAPGENVINIQVKKGEVFHININNFNEIAEMFLGGKVVFTASVSYDHSYVDGKCQHCGQEETQGKPGDVNGDGRINARDVRVLLQYLAGMSTEEPTMAVADFNGDGRINARDARAILTHIAGL